MNVQYRFWLGIIFIIFSINLFAQNVRVETLTLDGALSLDGLLMTPDGTLYGTEGYDGSRIFKIQMDGSTSIFTSGLNGPIDMDYDLAGRLYVSTFNNQGLYQISLLPSVTVNRLATVTTGPSGVVVNRASGDIYVSHYGAGFPGNGRTIYEVDSSGATNVFVNNNGLNVPVSLAIDEAGNLYAPNIGDARLFKITPEGNISLLAQLPTSPRHPFNIGHIAYANGELYLTGNSSQPLVHRVSLDGVIDTLAGTGQIGTQDGPADQATFDAPNGIAASVTGDTLFISELNNPGALRMIIFSPTALDRSPDAAPARFNLHQNYPNPFNPVTHIGFQMAVADFVKLMIYDSSGRLVKTLLNEHRAPGNYTVTWNGKNDAGEQVAGGIYFYRLNASNFANTHKMLYVR